MIRNLFSASFIILMLAAHVSAAINVVSVSRDTQANVTGGVQQQFTSTLAGPYNASFNVTNNLDPSGIGQAIANQGSTVPNLVGLSMNSSGAAHAQALPSGVTPLSATADSALDVYFTVTANQLYTLNSTVSWLNVLPGAFGGSSRVQLWDITNNLVPHDVQRDSMQPGLLSLNQQIPLSTGVTYRLRAESHVFGGSNDGNGVFDSEANWYFVLFAPPVPEPTSATLMALAIFAITCFSRRRQRA